MLDLASKKEILRSLGIREVWAIRTTRKFLRLKGEDFIRMVLKRTAITSLVVGDDFRFGHRGSSSLDSLQKFAAKYNFNLIVVKRKKVGGVVVSSSLIRRLIRTGKFNQVRKLLGKDFVLSAKVARGSGLGKRLGFPTANIESAHRVIPPDGVYAVGVYIDKRFYLGVCSVGVNPTLGKRRDRSVEVHVINFSGKIKHIKIVFIKKLRGQKKFPSFTHLQRAITEDRRTVLSKCTHFPRFFSCQ